MPALQETLTYVDDARAAHERLISHAPSAHHQDTVASRRTPHLFEVIARPPISVPQALLNAALENLHCGVMITDAAGSIRFANRRARSILERGDALISAAGVLQFLQPTLQRQFGAGLAKGRMGTSAHETPDRLVMRVPRKTGATDYALTMNPIDAEMRGYIVYVYDFERDGLAHELLEHVYGLTEAEARLATHLYNGESVQATAHALGIRESTARAHLTKIMSKCEVRSQSALLQRLALGPLA